MYSAVPASVNSLGQPPFPAREGGTVNAPHIPEHVVTPDKHLCCHYAKPGSEP